MGWVISEHVDIKIRAWEDSREKPSKFRLNIRQNEDEFLQVWAQGGLVPACKGVQLLKL